MQIDWPHARLKLRRQFSDRLDDLEQLQRLDVAYHSLRRRHLEALLSWRSEGRIEWNYNLTA